MSRTSPLTRIGAFAVPSLLLALVLAGCGDDSDSGPSGGDGASADSQTTDAATDTTDQTADQIQADLECGPASDSVTPPPGSTSVLDCTGADDASSSYLYLFDSTDSNAAFVTAQQAEDPYWGIYQGTTWTVLARDKRVSDIAVGDGATEVVPPTD